MRAELQDPITDKSRLERIRKLIEEIYDRFDAGKKYNRSLQELNQLLSNPLSPMDVEDMAELVDPETLAYSIELENADCPRDLTPEEMHELIDRVRDNKGEAWQIGYWLHCLEISTGNLKISELILYPEVYFQDPKFRKKLSAPEILELAYKGGHKSEGAE